MKPLLLLRTPSAETFLFSTLNLSASPPFFGTKRGTASRVGAAIAECVEAAYGRRHRRSRQTDQCGDRHSYRRLLACQLACAQLATAQLAATQLASGQVTAAQLASGRCSAAPAAPHARTHAQARTSTHKHALARTSTRARRNTPIHTHTHTHTHRTCRAGRCRDPLPPSSKLTRRPHR